MTMTDPHTFSHFKLECAFFNEYSVVALNSSYKCFIVVVKWLEEIYRFDRVRDEFSSICNSFEFRIRFQCSFIGSYPVLEVYNMVVFYRDRLFNTLPINTNLLQNYKILRISFRTI